MATGMPTGPSWPSGPIERHGSDDRTQHQASPDQAPSDQGDAQAAISELAGWLRDTRGDVLIGRGVLAAIAIGIALEAAFCGRVLWHGAAGVINVCLLCALLFCWMTTVALLAMAGRPVMNALSELRWVTGSPADPRVKWLTVPPMRVGPNEWTWIRAHLLVGAAYLARHRIQLADTWTYITAACFMIWTAAILLGR